MKIERSCRIKSGATVNRGRFRRICCSLLLVAAVVAAVGAFASPRGSQDLTRLTTAAPANIIVVTNTNDNGPGSLRDALATVNDGDTIDATGVSGAITLTSGELQITYNVTINGPGTENLAVNGNATFRVFENFASNVTVSGFTITNGLAADNINGGGGILNHGGLTLSDCIVSDSGAFIRGSGGGIFSDGATLTVTNTVISGNGCGGGGGGISADGGTVTVSNSTINGNGAGCVGGGISANNAQLTVLNSTISGNSCPSGVCQFGVGGGILSYDGTLTVMNSTISDNYVFNDGGGILCGGGGETVVMNSTISGNSADLGNGGGIAFGAGRLTVTNSTISDNSAAADGGGIHNYLGAAQIKDTVLNAGVSGGTISNDGGTVASLGYNLASDDAGGVLTAPGDQINTDPMLGPLQDNGGPTFTHALLPGSPGINAGEPSFTPPPLYDQRGPGFDRVLHGRIDIGSFEVQGPTPTPTPTLTPTPTPRPSPTPRPRPTVHPRLTS